MRFKGRTAVVTGAANGIGKATALRLAQEGAHVAALDLDKEEVERTVEEIRALGGMAQAHAVDVTEPAEVQGAVSAFLADAGRIDILVNSAGAGWHRQTYFHDHPIGSWQWILDVNINGTLNVVHAVIEPMIARNSGGSSTSPRSPRRSASRGWPSTPHPRTGGGHRVSGVGRSLVCDGGRLSRRWRPNIGSQRGLIRGG